MRVRVAPAFLPSNFRKSPRPLKAGARRASWRRSGMSLEQGRGPPCPVLALRLCDLFYVLHISSCLRQHVVQIVANADERESLVQKLADAGSAEQKKPKYHVILA